MFKEKIQNLRKLYYCAKAFSELEKKENIDERVELNFMRCKAVGIGILGGECDSLAWWMQAEDWKVD